MVNICRYFVFGSLVLIRSPVATSFQEEQFIDYFNVIHGCLRTRYLCTRTQFRKITIMAMPSCWSSGFDNLDGNIGNETHFDDWNCSTFWPLFQIHWWNRLLVYNTSCKSATAIVITRSLSGAVSPRHYCGRNTDCSVHKFAWLSRKELLSYQNNFTLVGQVIGEDPKKTTKDVQEFTREKRIAVP